MTHLYVAVSHHGLGHLAQTAPVLNALHAAAPNIRFTLRTALPESVLRARLDMPFTHVEAVSDCNLAMRDAIRADVPASLAAYRAFHRNWTSRVDAEARHLETVGADAVFSNVGYLPLAGARRAGLPSAALCSLNWADIFRHYLGHEPEAAPLLAQMTEAYAGADLFLRPEPSMPMADLANAAAIPPVAQPGRNRRAELFDRLRLAPGRKLVLVGMGGIPYRPPVEDWPARADTVFLVPDDWRADHPATLALRETGMVFRDVLASADALITKPGYGSYAEAAATGIPVLTIPRPDWPEAPYLNAWLAKHARMLEIAETDLLGGRLDNPLSALWSLPAKPAIAPQGTEVAAGRLATLLGLPG